MARDFIRLCGKEPDTEIEIRYIGLRPGEKLYEELITEGEGIQPTSHPKIMVLKGDRRDMGILRPALDRLKHYAARHDADGIKNTLVEVVPEYTPKITGAVLESSFPEDAVIVQGTRNGAKEVGGAPAASATAVAQPLD